MNAMSESKSSHSPRATVFVVDDEPMLLEMAALILEPLGYQVQTFRDPRAALEKYAAVRPTLVVTDYAMGSMTGMDLIRECKQINPRQKILLLSGTVDESIYAETALKPDRFLAKPYQVGDFVAVIKLLTAN